ncbi:MAG: hypothetical protein IIC55_11130 [Proteobacteria bacterium]|nr:hypothetical protein [Pseudomonadota bacterium]
MTGKDVYLKVENLTKMFGDFTALKDISLEVFEGEFICFLGLAIMGTGRFLSHPTPNREKLQRGSL